MVSTSADIWEIATFEGNDRAAWSGVWDIADSKSEVSLTQLIQVFSHLYELGTELKEKKNTGEDPKESYGVG